MQVTANFVLSCSGYYRYDHGYQPDFAGTDDQVIITYQADPGTTSGDALSRLR